MTQEQTMIDAREIVKSFAGFTVIDHLTLQVRRGAIHAVIGPNGAGKTTFFNVLSGFAPCNAGSVTFDGRDITRLDPAAIARTGMVRSFQINSIFPHLTALENVKIALQARTPLSRRFLSSSKATSVFDEPARAALAALRLDGDRSTIAANLSYGKKRALELAIALSQEPKVLLLDEPTSGMGSEDVEHMIELIGSLRDGRTIVLVEHNLKVVEHLCDRVTVLQRGTVLTEGSYADVRSDERVIDAYLGGVRK
jgi:branched-chain amino acid transport system ATP-binding protein